MPRHIIYYCIIILIYSTEINSTLLDGKILNGEDIEKQQNIKYMSRLYRNETYICNGCLISSRHIVSSAACIRRLIRNIKGIRIELFALIMQFKHKIINGVHHSGYKPGESWYYRIYDVGVALVRVLISFIC